MKEQHIRVSKTARYFISAEPGAEIEEIWIACHGYGQLAEYFSKHFQGIASPGRLIVVPEGLSRFYLKGLGGSRVGATWMTSEDRLTEIDDYLGYLDDLYQNLTSQIGSRPATTILGFSQGTATAARWAVQGQVKPQRLILWAGNLPPELDLADPDSALRQLQLLMVVGDADPFINESRLAKELTRLNSANLPYQRIKFEGAHTLDAKILQQIAES